MNKITTPRYYTVQSIAGAFYTDTENLDRACNVATKLATFKGEWFQVIDHTGVVFTAEPGPRYTLRAVGTDAVTEDGVERVMHGSNLDDLIVLAALSRFTCEVVDNATGQVVAQNGEAV